MTTSTTRRPTRGPSRTCTARRPARRSWPNSPRTSSDALLADNPLPRRTANTITDPGELRESLAEIRERGVAFDDEERDEGVRCVASAISDRSGELLGAISVSGPADRLTDERFRSEIPSRLRNVVGVVEFNTTYSEWSDAL
ncbi:IclR family transcriptional regulator [Halosimplex aquaticum]